MVRENPLNPRGVNEVLRREADLRRETRRRQTGSEDESGPGRNRSLIRRLLDRFRAS
jgi:hypothetical protein